MVRQMFLMGVAVLTGCKQDALPQPVAGAPSELSKIDNGTGDYVKIGKDESKVATLTEDEFELLKAVVCRFDKPDGGVARPGNSFITTTPSKDWTNRGGWKRLPKSFHDQINTNGTKYRPATEACLVDGKLTIPKASSTKAPPTITILEIIKWVSPTEAIVKETMWGGPLFGAGSTMVFRKVDGEWKWMIRETTNQWVS